MQHFRPDHSDTGRSAADHGTRGAPCAAVQVPPGATLPWQGRSGELVALMMVGRPPRRLRAPPATSPTGVRSE